MYFREKRSGGRSYLQIVEDHRENRHVRQRVVATLGRLDELRETGQLESLLASGARFPEKVEAIIRTVKSVLETRPVYHKCDKTIRGHVFCSLLSLIVIREFQDRMESRGWGDAEWADVLRDVERLEESEVEARDGKRFVIRSAAKGWGGKVLQAVGVAMPPTIRLAGEPGE